MAKKRKRNPFYARPDHFEGGQTMGVVSHPGFHTGDRPEVTYPYALQKAIAASYTEYTFSRSLRAPLDDVIAWFSDEERAFEFDQAVVVALDMSGLKKHWDYDIENMALPLLKDVIQQCPTLDDYEGYYEDYQAEEDKASTPVGLLFESTMVHTLNSPVDFEDEDDYQTFARELKSGKYSEAFKKRLMFYVGQFRYLDDVEDSRVTGVYFLPPIWPALAQFDDDEDIEPIEEAGWEVLVQYEEPNLRLKRVWGETADVEYHGTSLANLKLAIPDIAAQLPEPFKPSVPDFEN